MELVNVSSCDIVAEYATDSYYVWVFELWYFLVICDTIFSFFKPIEALLLAHEVFL